MSSFYLLGIDQSTQGTKGVLTDDKDTIIGRADRAHRQLVNEKGWVSHDLEEIYKNVLAVCHDVVEKTGIDRGTFGECDCLAMCQGCGVM